MSRLFPQDKEKGDVNVFTITVLLTGLFGGLGLVFWLGSMTFILIDTIFNIAFLSGLVVFLAHLPFRKRMNRFWVEIVLYCFFGWGLVIAGCFLGLNYFIHGHVSVDEYPVKSFEAYSSDRLPYPVSVTLDKQGGGHVEVGAAVYDQFPYLLKFDGEDELKYTERPKMAIIATATGLFGYRVLLNKEVR